MYEDCFAQFLDKISVEGILKEESLLQLLVVVAMNKMKGNNGTYDFPLRMYHEWDVEGKLFTIFITLHNMKADLLEIF